MGSSQYRLAKDISVPPRRINEIVHGKRSITADTALRLGRFSGMSPQFWLNLQTHCDLEVRRICLRAVLMTRCMRFRREQDIWKLSGVAYCMNVNYFIPNKADGGHSADKNSDLRRTPDDDKRSVIAISP